MGKIIILLLILFLVLVQGPNIKDIGEGIKQEFPVILEKIWEEEVIPLWKTMINKIKDWWNSSVWPFIKSIFIREIEEKKLELEQEFSKQKESMPELKDNLWGSFRELLISPF